jgi:hemerythrin superfamily protein
VQCGQPDKYIGVPAEKNSAAPSVLLEQHKELLVKAKNFSKNGDSTAVKLYEILQYHFNEEEQYVFPALGALPQLAAGEVPEKSAEIIRLSERFRSNSAKLLAEHQMIKTLMEEYKRGSQESDSLFDGFEKALTAHARSEEEIYFPAAIVAADYLKLKTFSTK